MDLFIQRILAFWFGEIRGGWPVEDRNTVWWDGGKGLDAEIHEQFGEQIIKAATGELSGWSKTAKGRLALILLLDQFPRNIYRRSAKAFATDSLALGTCLEGLETKQDQQLELIERVFFYLPLMHSEQLLHHDYASKLFAGIVSAANEFHKEEANRYFHAAKQHRDIILQFGRYPHRNIVLERPSTKCELVYLAGGPETFGQG